MSVLLDSNGFDRRPHNFKGGWYYEDPKGISVYSDGKLIGVIPWRSLQPSVKRANKASSRTAGTVRQNSKSKSKKASVKSAGSPSRR